MHTGQMKQAGVKKYKKFKLGDKYYDDYDLAEMCKMHSKFMKTRVESGHTKGVILGDKFTSLWLVHSVPRFPPLPDSKYIFYLSTIFLVVSCHAWLWYIVVPLMRNEKEN